MINADIFKAVFGMYATELWAMPEKDFLAWLNSPTEMTGTSGKDIFVGTNDLVSRQYLLTEYDRQHVGPPGGARKIIEEAPPVRNTDWIPCKDKMPEPDQLVLMQCRGKKWPSGYRYFPVIGVWIPPLTVKAEDKWAQDYDPEALEVYDEDTDTFYCETGWYEETTQGDGDGMSWKMHADVIAWMPLPAAYKGDKDGGQTD